MKKKPSEPFAGQPAIALLDEAVITLKRCDFFTLFCYYAGTAPFILSLLYFWAEMSAGAYAERNLGTGALGMALAFIWMKCWQSVFADRLMARLAGGIPIAWSPGRIGRLALQQTVIQGTSLYLLPVSALIAVPYGWVYAFYHKALLEGSGERGDRWRNIVRRSAEQAKFWPFQNHVGISWLLLVWLVVFINVLSLLFILPYLLKTVLGVETLFTRSHYSLLNTTVLMVALGLAHLIVDPVIKTFYLLRCFYGRARLSGVDLKVALRGMKATSLVLILGFLMSPFASASETTQMNERIDRVFERPEYAWRAPRVDGEKAPESSVIGKFVKATVDAVAKHLKPLKKWVKSAVKWVGKWMEKWFKKEGAKGRDGGGSWLPSASSLVYASSGLIVFAAAWVAWRGWRKRNRAIVIEPEIIHAMPDIRDEHLTADQLPEDRWMALAEKLIAEGELRLGLRAMYLAGLAHLGVREMVTLNRAKSNQEYGRELGRRARTQPDLVEAFTRNVRTFERAWYGEHPVTGQIIADYTTNLERIRSC